MQFDYSIYYRGCFVLPSSIALFSLGVIILATVNYIGRVCTHKVALKDTLGYIFILSILSFFIIMNVGRLIHGGMYLKNEKESDAVEMQGEIANIEGLGRFSFPELKSAYGYGDTNGVQFTINGIQCKASVKGDLEVGDYVTVVYLPKSGYILSISEIEDK